MNSWKLGVKNYLKMNKNVIFDRNPMTVVSSQKHFYYSAIDFVVLHLQTYKSLFE